MKALRLLCMCVLMFCAAAFAQTAHTPRTPTSSVAMAHDPALPAPGPIGVTADFNGDGKMDVATVNNPNGGVTIRLGKGDGTFLPPVTYHPRYHYEAIVVGDFNGDGKLDLAVSVPFLCEGCGGEPTSVLQVFFGAGDGTFTAVTYSKPIYGLPVAVGDFNGDGKQDLIVTGPSYDGTDWFPSVALSNGDGTFRQGASLGDTFYLTYPAVGDFNGDGKLDIALPGFDYYQGNPVTNVYLGKGDGTFAPRVTYTSPQYWVASAAVADLNGDGKLDIITDGIQVLLNNGDGTFTNDASVNLAGSNVTGGVAVGDFQRRWQARFRRGSQSASVAGQQLCIPEQWRRQLPAGHRGGRSDPGGRRFQRRRKAGSVDECRHLRANPGQPVAHVFELWRHSRQHRQRSPDRNSH